MVLPARAKKVGVKWIYKIKLNEHGKLNKYKERLVVKWYIQQYGIDYTEVFPPLVRMDIIRIIITLAAEMGWKLHQLDVKSSFLHGNLEVNIYVEQSNGYKKEGCEQNVYNWGRLSMG